MPEPFSCEFLNVDVVPQEIGKLRDVRNSTPALQGWEFNRSRPLVRLSQALVNTFQDNGVFAGLDICIFVPDNEAAENAETKHDLTEDKEIAQAAQEMQVTSMKANPKADDISEAEYQNPDREKNCAGDNPRLGS